MADADFAEAKLKALAWSCGDLHCRTADGRQFWIVLANRGEHRIVGKADRQAEAWIAAAGMAGRHGLSTDY